MAVIFGRVGSEKWQKGSEIVCVCKAGVGREKESRRGRQKST